MSGFDEAMRFSDDAAFAEMGESIEVCGPQGSWQRADAVVGNPESGTSYRMGSGSQLATLEVELLATDVAVFGVEDGWRIRHAGREYRIMRLVPQGSTVTAICGPLSEQL